MKNNAIKNKRFTRQKCMYFHTPAGSQKRNIHPVRRGAVHTSYKDIGELADAVIRIFNGKITESAPPMIKAMDFLK